MSKFKLVLVATVSLATGVLLGTVMPWWATAIMIAAALAFVAVRSRSK